MWLSNQDAARPLMPWEVRKHGGSSHDQLSHGSWANGGAGGAAGSSGSKDDDKSKPLRTSDHDEAIRALAEGRLVELESEEDIYTLVDKLAAYARDAQAKGEKAPHIDLCKVSVPGTNLFCAGNLGIERVDMPQLSGKAREGSIADGLPKNDKGEVNVGKLFTEALAKRRVEVSQQEVPASSLRASQKELVGINVAWMMTNAEQAGIHEGRIFVSRDGYVIDGHHRWAALVGLDTRDGDLGDMPIRVERIDMNISEVLQFANRFADEIGILPKAAKRRVPLGQPAYWRP